MQSAAVATFSCNFCSRGICGGNGGTVTGKTEKIPDDMLHMQYKKRAVLLGTARKPPFGILTMCMKSYMESRRKQRDSAQRDVQNHHHTEADGEKDRADVRVLSLGHLGDH